MRITRIIRMIFVLALVVAMASQLAACGRKSSPVPPSDDKYPRHYPAG